jgi:two-component system sensor histidine kinase ChiS
MKMLDTHSLKKLRVCKIFSFRLSFVPFIFVILLVSVLTIAASTKSQAGVNVPIATDGILDLTGWDFNGNTLINLDGEWEFYWKQLHDPDYFQSNRILSENRDLISLPRSWNGYEINGIPIDGMGYATFRLIVQLPDNGVSKSLELPSIYTAHKLWINGELVSSDGLVSRTAEGSEPKHFHKVIPLKQSSGTVEIIIQVSNFMHRRGGIWQPIKFGNSSDILKFRERQILIDMTLFGALLIMGLYHLVLFALRRKDRSPLYFGIFCLLVSLRVLLVGEIILLYFFPQISQEFALKAEYFTFYLGISFFTLFIHSLFPEEMPGKISVPVSAVGFGYSFIVIIAKADFYSHILIYYQVFSLIVCTYILVALLIATFRKRDGVLLVLTGSLIFVGTVFNDIFYFNEKLFTGSLTPFGLFIFTLAQSFVISSRFSKAFKTVEDMSQRLLSMDKLKDEFLANITHEILTPLNGMVGMAESIGDSSAGKLSSQQISNLSLIASSGRRLALLVHDILDFTKLKNRDVILKTRSVNVRHVAQVVLALCKPLTIGKQLELYNDVPDDLPLVIVDENRLQQIFYNLIGNAIKFTRTGSVKITAEQKDGFAEIIVADTGIGIPADEINNIFDDFEQINNPDYSGYAGIGLGLSITKKLVELHGGTITVDSEQHKGSKFMFTLPISKNSNSTEKPGSKSFFECAQIEADVTSESQINDATGRILVVDDEPVNRQVLVSQLITEKYSVEMASNGMDALEKINTNMDFDLVILDVMMPGMSGYEVCRHIREKYSILELPVLILTVRNRIEDIIQAFENGASDYLPKPFDRKEMLARVRTLLTMKRALKQAVNAELKFLQAQIKPHFLYNTLNTIMGFCVKEPRKAYKLIDELSNYLQCKFRFISQDNMTTLEDELELVKSYLSIETARFGNRLKVEYDIEEDINLKIPSLILQPLVENAIKHGIYPKTAGGLVSISVHREQDCIIMCVRDDGMGMPQHKADSILSGQAEISGIGVRNLDERLRRYYGRGLRIISEVEKGTTAIIEIPYSNTSELSSTHRTIVLPLL